MRVRVKGEVRWRLTAEIIHSGHASKWESPASRWDEGRACLFAPFDEIATMADIIDTLLADFDLGGEAEAFPADIEDHHVRLALLEALTPEQREEHESSEPCSWAKGLLSEAEDVDEFIVVAILAFHEAQVS